MMREVNGTRPGKKRNVLWHKGRRNDEECWAGGSETPEAATNLVVCFVRPEITVISTFHGRRV